MRTRTRLITVCTAIVTAFSLSGCSLIQYGLYMKNAPEQPAGTEAHIETDAYPETETNYYLPELTTQYEMYEAEEEPDLMFDSYSSLGNQYLALGEANGVAYELAASPSFPEYSVPDWNTEEYSYYQENGWLSASTSPFSTFAADTDTASYANVRKKLFDGSTIPNDAVRIEEWINYFHYDYPAAGNDDAFSVTTEIAPCPWNEDTRLMMIGLKAKEADNTERTASNLVFLIDVSGSMDEPDKLPLVQRAFRMLAEELGDEDRISIVTYASNDTVVLEGVPGSEKAVICDAIEDLFASGGTNGSDGINTAYRIAEENYIDGGNNRIILATDGDLNIGITDEGSLTRLIKEKAKSGVFLSVLGFGQGNISDTNMLALADNGNGNYSYIDNISEARRVLIEEAGGTLFTVAKDVKLQVEFNPKKVKGYRLIGYEKRTMAAEDFADDTKDGGEIGSGHTVTALFEIASADSAFDIPAVESKYSDTNLSQTAGTDEYANEWATLHIRYKEPDQDESILCDTIIDDSSVTGEMDENLSWASGVAQAAMVLKGSEYAGTTDLDEVKNRLKMITGDDDIKEEFVYLLTRIRQYIDNNNYSADDHPYYYDDNVSVFDSSQW